MAKYASPRSPNKRDSQPPGHFQSPLAQQLPLVSGRWLFWSLFGVFGGGLALVYLTMCLLFWQGQWQILFHPMHPVSIIGSVAPGERGFKEVSFAPDGSGHPSLDGFLVTAAGDALYAAKTVFYLQDTTDQAPAHTMPTIEGLQDLGINVFAFDYRGFGKSADMHPSEQLATEDTEAAWSYLVDTRHVAASSIIFYGQGLGASLAAEAAAHHPEAAGVILDSPAPTALELLRADPRSRWMPVRLLAHDRFDPAPALETTKLPKLFLLPEQNIAGPRYASLAADPKLIVHLPPTGDGDARNEALKRFLDQLP